MRGRILYVPGMLVLALVVTSCSATKPGTQTVSAAPVAVQPTAVEEASLKSKTVTETTAVTVDSSEDEAIQLALKQEADEYRKQVAEDIMTAVMVKGTEMMIDKAMSKAGANNPFTKLVVKAAMDDMKKKAAANMKTAEGAAVMDITAVLGRARNNNARLGKMVVTVDLLVDKRKKDTVKIKVASIEEKKRFAAKLDADEALLALALAASEEELAKIQKAGEKDTGNKDLVAEIETTRKQSVRIKEAMLVMKTMRKAVR